MKRISKHEMWCTLRYYGAWSGENETYIKGWQNAANMAKSINLHECEYAAYSITGEDDNGNVVASTPLLWLRFGIRISDESVPADQRERVLACL